MVHNKTIFTITEIIFPQQGMEIWNFHFHYKLSMYLEKYFGPAALTIYLQHRLKTYCVFLKKN